MNLLRRWLCVACYRDPSREMSLWVGFRVAGLPGAAVAFVMVMAPALVLMASLMTLYAHSPMVYGSRSHGGGQTSSGWITRMGGLQTRHQQCGGLEWSSHRYCRLYGIIFQVHPALVMGFALAIGALLMRVPQ